MDFSCILSSYCCTSCRIPLKYQSPIDSLENRATQRHLQSHQQGLELILCSQLLLVVHQVPRRFSAEFHPHLELGPSQGRFFASFPVLLRFSMKPLQGGPIASLSSLESQVCIGRCICVEGEMDPLILLSELRNLSCYLLDILAFHDHSSHELCNSVHL